MQYNQFTIHLKPKPESPLKIEGATWIPLSREKFAIVDDIDAIDVLKINWYAFNPKPKLNLWYAANKTKLSYITLYRYIANKLNFNANNLVDHVDHNGLNCRRNNLRDATRTQNNGNDKFVAR
jgi:hypothetical protein